MVTLNDIKVKTGFDYSLDKSGSLIVRENGKKVKDSSYEKIHVLVEETLGLENIESRIIEMLYDKNQYKLESKSLTYGEEYLGRQLTERFVVTSLPMDGYKLTKYPSGHDKIGKNKQNMSIKIKQAQSIMTEEEIESLKNKPPFEVLYSLESYEPFNEEVFFKDSNEEDYYLNMYRPSLYMEIYRGYYPDIGLLPIGRFSELPNVLQAFFIHLLPDQRDRNYLLQWLAWSVFEQCETIPIMFGAGGTGKGVLTGLWSRMLGENNWTSMNASSLEGEFSMANFVSKRGVSVNEGKMTNPQQIENLKNSTDRYIRVNDKHEKFKTIKKTHSMMYTANHLDSIKGLDVEGERRFSFLGITDTKLRGSEIILSNGEKVVFDRENLNLISPPTGKDSTLDEITFALFSYLANMYDSKSLDTTVMNEAHNNEKKSKEINEASLPNWYMDIIEDILVKCEFTKCQMYSDFSQYVYADDILLMYRNQNPKPKIIPSFNLLVKQFKNRELVHHDVMVKNGKTVRKTKVYIHNNFYSDLFELGDK